MSFMTAQTNIYSGSNNILFCYRDNNNYYKLSYNKDSAVLSKLINGVEYVLSESSSAVSADDEFSLKVSRNINGTITVTSGTKAGDGTGNFISVSYTHLGKQRLLKHNLFLSSYQGKYQCKLFRHS